METKVAIVTGGSRGIGRACVLALAQEGFDVVFSYQSNQSAAESVKAEVEALGRKAMAIQADAASESQAQQLIDKTVEAWGRLDALVNNAGITRDNLLLRMKTDEWQTVLDTNLSGVFYTVRAASKIMMKQRQGRIVNITSISGIYGNPGQANYSASKAGVIGFTKSVAKELASRNIQVNAVAPGFIQTDMTDALPLDQIAERIPLKRLGTPEDIAKAVVFLVMCGDYITGQVIQVDGGLVI